MLVRCLLLFLVACAPSRFLLNEAPAQPFDAVIVLGCPNNDDGSLSRCQLGRAGLAALIWQRGQARYFITSGGSVHTPYVEAEAIAEAMVVLGVPAERILLEPNALHTDENVWNGFQIAKLLGLSRIAVASNGGHAEWACQMLEDYGAQNCRAIPMVMGDLEKLMPPFDARLKQVRSRKIDPWVPMAEQELAREQRTGRSRPASMFLYPMLAYLRWIDKPWRPIGPEKPALVTWAKARAVMRPATD
jgi:vancomycin permeability regulator SanA